MATYYCRKSVPVKLNDGRVLSVLEGQYVEVAKPTSQLNRYLKNKSLIRRNAPAEAVVHRPQS